MDMHLSRILIKIFPSDCIGSAFNAKGQMECPNCRQVERGGRWLYGNGSGSLDLKQDDPIEVLDPVEAERVRFH